MNFRSNRMNFGPRHYRKPDVAYWALVAVILTMLALSLAACTSQPLSQQLATGYKEANDYLTRTEALYDAKIIDKAAAQQRLDQVKAAKLALDAAVSALVSCTTSSPPTPTALCTSASLKASTAQSLLNSISIYLLSKEKH